MYVYIYVYIHIHPIPIHTYRLDDAMIKNHSSFSLACCFLTHSRRNFSSFSKYDPGVPIMQTLLDCLTKADNKKFVHEPRHACHLFSSYFFVVPHGGGSLILEKIIKILIFIVFPQVPQRGGGP